MKNYLEKNIKIGANDVDASMQMSLPSLSLLFQELATENADKFGYSRDVLIERDNAFYVISKIRFKISELPLMGQTVKAKTWPLPPGKIIITRNFSVLSHDGGSMIAGTSEWCIMDTVTRRPKRVHGTCISESEGYLSERSSAGEFSREKYSPQECVLSYERVIRSSDIDMNGHTNNTKYTYMAVDCFSNDYLKKHTVSEFEIHFLNESYEGDILSVYRKEISDNAWFITAVTDGLKTVFNCLIVFKERICNE